MKVDTINMKLAQETTYISKQLQRDKKLSKTRQQFAKAVKNHILWLRSAVEEAEEDADENDS